jgi:O-antigen ligase
MKELPLKKMERMMVDQISSSNSASCSLGWPDSIKMSAFALIVLLSLFTKNAIISLSLFSILIFLDRKYIIPLLLLTPLVETILLVKEGFTITRFVAIMFAGIFCLDLMTHKKIHHNKSIIALFMLYIIITILGLLNSIAFGEYVVSVDWNDWAVVSAYLKAGLPKILISIMLYLYFSKRGLGDVWNILNITVYTITISIILVSGYFIFYGNNGSLWYDLVRVTFQDADPNEYSCMIVGLSCFPMYLLLAGKNIYDYLLGLISMSTSFYSVTLTLSRAGVLTIVLLIIISALYSIKIGRKAIRRFIAVTMVFCLAVLPFAGEKLKPLYARFVGYGTNIEASTMTAGRSDLWKSGLVATGEKLLLGHGGSTITSRWVNQKALGRSSVMHNLYLEILVQYGLLGFSIFMMLVIVNYKRMGANAKKLVDWDQRGLLYLPSIALLLLLFAALSLSWEWREIVWYLLGISLGIGSLNSVSRHERSGQAVLEG